MINQMYQSGKGATALMIGTALSGVNVVGVLYTQTSSNAILDARILVLRQRGAIRPGDCRR